MEKEGDPAGQHRTVGVTLAVMGTVFSGLALYLIAADFDMAFISPQGMLVSSVIFIIVGAWQWLSARKYE